MPEHSDAWNYSKYLFTVKIYFILYRKQCLNYKDKAVNAV